MSFFRFFLSLVCVRLLLPIGGSFVPIATAVAQPSFQTDQVYDVDHGSQSPTSFGEAPVGPVGGVLLTGSGIDPLVGDELYALDGTTEGATLLLDIFEGPQSSTPSDMVAFDGAVYFAATSLAHGRELWRTDGTAPGTERVTDIMPGRRGSRVDRLVVSDEFLFFTCAAPGVGHELCAWDGTNLTVIDVDPASTDPDGVEGPEEIHSLRDGRVCGWWTEAASSSATSHCIDGSSVFRVDADCPACGVTGEGVDNYAPSGNDILFEGADALWRYDPTSETLHAVPIASASSPPQIGKLIGIAGAVYFAADGLGTRRLFRYDPGTQTVSAVLSSPGNDLLTPVEMAEVDGILYVAADDGQAGMELWRADPLGSTASLALDLDPGSGGSGPRAFLVADEHLYFVASLAGGPSLYRFDTDDDSVVEISNDGARAWTESSFPVLEWEPDIVYRQSFSPTSYFAVPADAGTSDPTRLAPDIEHPQGVFVEPQLVPVADDVGFVAFQSTGAEFARYREGSLGVELSGIVHSTSTEHLAIGDGFGGGWGIVTEQAELFRWLGSSIPEDTGVVGPEPILNTRRGLLFEGSAGSRSNGLHWLPSGGGALRSFLLDLEGGQAWAAGDSIVMVPGVGPSRTDIYEWFPTSPHESPALEHSFPFSVAALGVLGEALLLGGSPISAELIALLENGELWTLDMQAGTAGGPALPPANLAIPATAASGPNMVSLNRGQLFLVQALVWPGDPGVGNPVWELFVVNPAARLGMIQVSDRANGGVQQQTFEPQILGETEAGWLVLDEDSAHGREVWFVSGTDHRVLDLWPGSSSSQPRHLGIWHDFHYFVATLPGAGEEIVRTDGHHVEVVVELHDGAASEPIDGGVVAPPNLYFWAIGEGGERKALWKTALTIYEDGFESGTLDDWNG